MIDVKNVVAATEGETAVAENTGVMMLSAMPETENHIVINSDRSVTVPDELQNIAVQFDHNIETVTFDCPRYWDGHDFSTMHVYVNYRCADGNLGQYQCETVTVDESDDSLIHFDWTISRNVTCTNGKISFLVCVKSVDGNGTLKNHWSSRLNQQMEILEGLECPTEEIVSDPDVIEQILVRLDNIENNNTIALSNVFINKATNDETGETGYYLVAESADGKRSFTFLPNTTRFFPKDPTDEVYDNETFWYNTTANRLFIYFNGWHLLLGDVDNSDIHADYFDITRDGLLSLKPEYRGTNTRDTYPFGVSDMGVGVAGSKNAQLPEHLIIPETVDGVVTCTLAEGMFMGNNAVINVTFPSCVEEISKGCFAFCDNMRNLYNTEHVKRIGSSALRQTAIRKALFPNLSELTGAYIFASCGSLVYADVGDVTTVPEYAFRNCVNLNRVKSNKEITSIGKKAFACSFNLSNLDFLDKTTSIGDCAFLPTRFDYDWASLTNCTFGTDATRLQYNPTDFWSDCTYTPCENPLPTKFSQKNPAWENDDIGVSGVKYSVGCLYFVTLHAYCGIHNIVVTSPDEFETIINAQYPGHIDTYSQSANGLDTFAQGMGLTATSFTEINQNVLQTLYDALAAGGYAAVVLGGINNTLAHVVLAYGINDEGELLILDSEGYFADDKTLPSCYAVPYKNLQGYRYNGAEILTIISP